VGGKMSSRARRTKSWRETHSNVVKAKRFAERYGVDDAHPDDYIPLSVQQPDWDDLLNKLK
jgi:hypothetical protein